MLILTARMLDLRLIKGTLAESSNSCLGALEGVKSNGPVQEAQQIQKHGNRHDVPIQLSNQFLLPGRVDIMLSLFLLGR